MLNVLQRLLGGDTPPDRVLEIKSESLGTLQVIARDDSMLLFAPPINTNEKKALYELILQRPTTDSNTTSFSLFRSTSKSKAEDKFNCFLHRLPVFMNIVKEYYSVTGLQKVCDILTENSSWSLAHLIVYFNLTDYILNPKVLQFVDYADHKDLMSPLQLAIKCGHMDMVKVLIPLSKLEHLDNNSNSVFHYAASSNKDIINKLTQQSTVNLNHFNSEGYTPLHLACLSDRSECVNALLLAGADVNRSARKDKIYQTSAPTSVASFLKNKEAKKLYSQDMKFGGTPLHWCSSRETLHALIMQGCDVNATNFDGRTALHVMVARNRFECVVTLLAHDADIDVRDKHGDTPLHIAIRMLLVPIVQCLVVFGCDINMKNNENFSPRHMVGNEASGGKEDEILYILHSVGAKRCPADNTRCPPGCNASGTYNGIPPEAPESVDKREHVDEMLASTSRTSVAGLKNFATNGFMEEKVTEPPVIVDTEKEKKGQSMMDALLGMFISKVNTEESPSSTPEVGSGSSTAPQSPTSESAQKKITDDAETSQSQSQKGDKPYGRGRLLCLDGGGIRGLVLVQMLLEIEKLSQTPIIHLFDWIAGTSTGGILALGLGCGKTMRQCMGLYLRMKEQCFIGLRPYPSDRFESILRDNLGEYTTMSDIKHPKIMVTGVMADRKPVDLHLFRNFKNASDILGIVTPINNRREPPPEPEDQLVWRAARATGAAPTYFRSFGRFLDGGLVANNPTLDAMTEIHEYNMALRSVGRENEAVPVSIVVSLGTGLIPVTELKDIDLYRPEGFRDTFKAVYGLSTIINLLVDQATASDGRVVDRARAWCSTIGVPYYRFNPQLSEDIAMDEKDDQKLVNMLWCAKAYIHSNRTKVMEMINCLKDKRSKI